MANIPNILPVDLIDGTRMLSALVARHEPHFDDDRRRQDAPGSPYHDTRSIYLRAPDGYFQEAGQGGGAADEALRELWFADVPHMDTNLMQSWPSARGLLQAIRDSHIRRAGEEPVFGKVLIESLKPGGFIDWHADSSAYAATYNRFHLCLKQAPGNFLFAGADWRTLAPNELTFVNNRALHSAVNFGPWDRIHLIADIRIPDQAKMEKPSDAPRTVQ